MSFVNDCLVSPLYSLVLIFFPTFLNVTDDREEVADHVCPLRLQMAWSAPDHVFRLCRRASEDIKDEDSKDTLDGWLVILLHTVIKVNARGDLGH